VCHSVDEWAVQEKSDGVRGGKDGDDNGELDLGEAYSFDRVLEGRLEEGKDLAIHVIQSRPGEFLHQKSGIEYRLFLRDKEVWLSYARPQGKGAMDIVGEQRLVYYIGSGHRGRTYLFERNGFWFESPVNWYSKTQLWDMNPKSLVAKEMPFTLQVDSTCLHCHTSGTAISLQGSRNHFAGVPFAEGGITCESCHGDASAHLAQNGRGPILNPGSLIGSLRDSICLQCHLEAEVAVNQPGKSLNNYRPGDDLSEDVRFFVHRGEIGSGGRATSQWEALLQSACYRKSAGRMTCTTCHDPHSDPPPKKRVDYFRSKCLTCHSDPAFVARHHPQQPNCTLCHIKREKTENVAHEQVTDHFIVKRPSAWLAADASHEKELVAVGDSEASDRDLGLAYAQSAIEGDVSAAVRGRELLEEAEKQERKDPAPPQDRALQDADLHAKLGYLNLVYGDISGAAREYELALAMDPADSIAAADLAVIHAKERQLPAAVQLWRSVAQENPAETGAGYDLALGECMLGDPNSAVQALNHVIAFSPDNQKAKELLIQLKEAPQLCAAQAKRLH
jgi:tetratricopeptide (TPR) repeat protein